MDSFIHVWVKFDCEKGSIPVNLICDILISIQDTCFLIQRDLFAEEIVWFTSAEAE